MNDSISNSTWQRKTYGSTKVSGHAIAQLGDRYNYRDTVHIAHASIYLDGHSQRRGPNLVPSLKRSHDETNQCGLSDHEAGRPCPKRHRPEALGLLKTDHGLKRSLIESITSTHMRQPVSSVRIQDQDMIDMVIDGLSGSSTASTVFQQAPTPTSPDSAVGSSTRTLLQTFKPATTFVLTVCRRLIQNGLLHTLLRSLNESEAQTAANTLTLLTSRVPLNKQLLSAPEEFITFEDVYQRRRPLSWSVLEFPETLEGFFKAHYLGASAQDFVSRGQFNLIIDQGGQRHELVSMQDACRSGRKHGPETVLRMAILFRANTGVCLVCYNPLSVTGVGTYTCTWCKREFRNHSKQSDRACQLRPSVFVVPPWQTLQADASKIANGGICNVDIDTRWTDYWAIYSHRLSQIPLATTEFRPLLPDIKEHYIQLETFPPCTYISPSHDSFAPYGFDNIGRVTTQVLSQEWNGFDDFATLGSTRRGRSPSAIHLSLQLSTRRPDHERLAKARNYLKRRARPA